jgi:hypothetical protein
MCRQRERRSPKTTRGTAEFMEWNGIMGRKKTIGAQCCASTSGKGYSFIAVAPPHLAFNLTRNGDTSIGSVHPTNDFVNCDSSESRPARHTTFTHAFAFGVSVFVFGPDHHFQTLIILFGFWFCFLYLFFVCSVFLFLF